MKFIFLLLLIPYYRFKQRMTPEEFIRMRNLLSDKMSPSSAEFFRNHPDTVQLFHRIGSHGLRSPHDYDGIPPLKTLLRDLRDIAPTPDGRDDLATLTTALRSLDERYEDVYSVVADAVCTYSGTEPIAPASEQANVA